MTNIRKLSTSDSQAVIDIYNQAIRHKFQTAETEEVSIEDKKDWLTSHLSYEYPIYVYSIDGKVVGWISLSPYRQGRKALRYTVEVSYYIHNDYKRMGIASKLMSYTIEKSKELGYKNLFAIILDKNSQSVKLLENFGFKQWAHMPMIADFDGEECGHVYYGARV